MRGARNTILNGQMCGCVALRATMYANPGAQNSCKYTMQYV